MSLFQKSVEKKYLNDLDTSLIDRVNYLEAYVLEVGLLINFGVKSLYFKRLNNKKFNQKIGKIKHSINQGSDNG